MTKKNDTDWSTLIDLIDRSEVVSFDVFETLVWRIYQYPVDLFAHIEESCGAPKFREERQTAEMRARSLARVAGRDEVTLDEIYQQLPAALRKYKQIEIDQEIASCYRDDWMYNIYSYALSKGKRIVLASDMYLPETVIKTILSNAGYDNYERLFLSSVTLHPKATGLLFRDLIDYAQVPANKILHIGDNNHSDFVMPQAAGLQAYLYVPALERLGGVAEQTLFQTLAQAPFAGSAVNSLFQGLVAHYRMKNPEPDYWERFGYVYGGPIASGFCQWIREQCDENKISHVAFLARDGYIFKEAFDALYPDFSTSYVYASRRCFLLAALKSVDKSFLDLIASEHLLDRYDIPWTFKDFLHQLALDEPELALAFRERFPEQDAAVKTAEQLEKVREFFEDYEDTLLAAGARERADLLAYFDRQGLFSEPLAIVDLGWKGTLYKNMRAICRLGNKTFDPLPLYYATHEYDTFDCQLASYALDQGRPQESVLNTHLGVTLLEMMFSALHPSILKLRRAGNEFEPVYRDEDNGNDKARLDELSRIKTGILKFVEDYAKATKELPLDIPGELSVGPLKSFIENVTVDDRRQFANVDYVGGIGNVQRYERIMPPYQERCFALVSPWPGSLSAENELIVRICKAAREIGVQAVPVSCDGRLLNREYQLTGNVIVIEEIPFAIALHYDTIKTLDTFYYFSLWNPPEIPLRTPLYPRAVDSYISYDDYLTTGSTRIRNHLRSITRDTPRPLDGMSELFPSFSASAMMEPSLRKPILFYCGMNWEKVVYGTGARHEGLLKLLDRSGKIKFFGPERIASWGGIHAWEGFTSYCGMIPFDGHSIIEEINKCGVVLVLSSNDHRRSGMATTRLYEACVGGGVIISDDNPFVLEHFKDAALFIDYDVNNPTRTFSQIMEKFDWIQTHREEAIDLVKRAQAIFRAKFTLEGSLQAIFAKHDERKALVSQYLHARSESEKVLAVYVIEGGFFDIWQKVRLERIIENVRRQDYQNIHLVVACDVSIQHLIRYYCEKKAAGVQIDIVPRKMINKQGTSILTQGNVIDDICREFEHDFLMFTGSTEIWYRDHVTTLKRQLENNLDAVIAYSGRSSAERDGRRTLNRFGPVNMYLFLEATDILPGELLFRRTVEEYLQPFDFDFLDGIEYFAYFLMAHYKHGKQAVFSHRITFAVAPFLPARNEALALIKAAQIRFVRDLVRFEIDSIRAESLQGPGDATAPAGNGQEALSLRNELLARTTELVTMKAALQEAISVRDKHLENVRRELAERTAVSEALLSDIADRDEELIKIREILVERTRIAEDAIAQLNAMDALV
ncbi:hypothetical protein [Gluconacetobacter dulcium]|nr:hypothetical protein [Gluconacetobacter dulcium]